MRPVTVPWYAVRVRTPASPRGVTQSYIVPCRARVGAVSRRDVWKTAAGLMHMDDTSSARLARLIRVRTSHCFDAIATARIRLEHVDAFAELAGVVEGAILHGDLRWHAKVALGRR